MLGRIFQHHSEVAYWPEPRHVWMHAFPYRRFDVMREEDARPGVIDKIHDEFLQFLDEQGRSRFAEKTPSNMVRLMAFNSARTLRRSIFTVAIYYSAIYFPLVHHYAL